MRRIHPDLLMAVLFAGAVSDGLSQTFTRGPFLQLGTPTRASVCWRVSSAAALTVRFGTDSANLNRITPASASSTNACVILDTLQPDARYYYRVYNGGAILSGQQIANQFVKTPPPVGTRKKYTFWVIGDFGTGLTPQARVRDAFIARNGGPHSDGVLMLGDNAYESGTDAQITSTIFAMYPTILSNSFAWPAIGNHDSPNIAQHFAAWTLPAQAQAGGVASNVEHYYSFDHGNIHFIVLDSEISSRNAGQPQYQWLSQDLQSLSAQQADWIVAFYHHPAYTCCYHNSESEQKHKDLRWSLLPLMDQYGVDLHLAGHSHNYERTWLLDSAYGASQTGNVTAQNNWFTANRSRIVLDGASGNPDSTGPYRKIKAGNKGAVHAVVGSAGKLNSSTGQHLMVRVKIVRYGSMLLEVEDSVLTARWFDTTGTVMDKFQIVKTRPGPVNVEEKVESVPSPRNLAPAKFTQAGRRFQFARGNSLPLRVYAMDGRLLLQDVPKGAWEPPRAALPAGEYYLRYGGTFGKVSLP